MTPSSRRTRSGAGLQPRSGSNPSETSPSAIRRIRSVLYGNGSNWSVGIGDQTRRPISTRTMVTASEHTTSATRALITFGAADRGALLVNHRPRIVDMLHRQPAYV